MKSVFLLQFTHEENKIIERVFSFRFPYQEMLLQQMAVAKTEREIYPNHYFLFFEIPKSIPSLPDQYNGVPVAIDVTRANSASKGVAFSILMHISDGYASEMEIFSADGEAFLLQDVLGGVFSIEREYNLQVISGIVETGALEITDIHVVSSNSLPDFYIRFQSADHGAHTLLCMRCSSILYRNLKRTTAIDRLQIQQVKECYVLRSADRQIEIWCSLLCLDDSFGF